MTAPPVDLAAVVRVVVNGMWCECYDPASMEYAPAPCPRCRLEEALEAQQ